MYNGFLVFLVQCVLPDVLWLSCIARAMCAARCTLGILYCLCNVWCQRYIGCLVLLVQCVLPDVHWLSCIACVMCGARCTFGGLVLLVQCVVPDVH